MIQTLSQSIESLVMDVGQGKLLIPEMQRGYVWKATQVRDLFDSLYHQYPSGQLLVWETDDLPSGSRQASIEGLQFGPRSPRLLLDGQQRLTSLTAVMLGKPLVVRDVPKPIDIVFNIISEKFEVAVPRHTIQNKWVSLTRIFTEGSASALFELALDLKSPEAKTAHERLSQLENIKKYQYHINVLVHMSYTEVTSIFVRTNSGGTTLSNADLALAQISSSWHGVTKKFGDYQEEFKKHNWGLELNSGLLLRAMVVLLTNQTRFSRLFRNDKTVTVDEIEEVWERTKKALDRVVSFLVQNCLIDHLDMLPTHSILMPLVAFYDRFGDHVTDKQMRDLQRWVYIALIWTHYSSSSESTMDQDIAALSKDNPIQAMIEIIEKEVGRRPVTEQELRDQRKNSPFMLMAYVLARQAKAQDWFTGIAIANDLTQQEYHVHHIFPKSLLSPKFDLRKESRTVDQVANLAFLTDPLTRSASNRPPASYLPEIDQRRIKAQYIPLEPKLWDVAQFENFALERRTMLANAINQLLQSLSEEKQVWTNLPADILDARITSLEMQLRRVIAARLRESRGDEAWDYLVPTDIRNSVKNRIKKQEGNMPFTAGQSESLETKLGFCLYSDLFKIMKDNWNLFQDIFASEQQLNTHKQYVIDARNGFKHGNPPNDVVLSLANSGLLWLEACLNPVIIEGENGADKMFKEDER